MSHPEPGPPPAGAASPAAPQGREPKLLSVVVPCFNEEQVIGQTHARLTEVLRGLGPEYEILYVNDGSRDGTMAALRAIHAADRHARVLCLSRNFGHQAAVTAGLDHARGQAVVLIDADLQDPPEVIAEMLDRWREGYDVAYGRRTKRPGESPFKLWTASAFYRLINKLSDVNIPLDVGDFRLMDRKAVDALKQMPERDRFIRGMVAWAGYRQVAVEYERHVRAAGGTKYPLKKMVLFAIDGILSFSLVPLKMAVALGGLVSSLSLLGIIYALVLRLFTSIWVSGWTLLFISVMFIGGIQLICLGVIGEYVGRIYMEVKRRPLYLLDAAPAGASVEEEPEFTAVEARF